MKKVVLLVGVLCLVLIGCSGGEDSYESDPAVDSFAQCISQSGTIMYGTNWCSHCKRQKEMFGNSFKFIKFVDCDKNAEQCLNNGVQSYPTWNKDGANYPGVQSFNELAEISGCQAPI